MRTIKRIAALVLVLAAALLRVLGHLLSHLLRGLAHLLKRLGLRLRRVVEIALLQRFFGALHGAIRFGEFFHIAGAQILESRGHSVFLADTGRQAVDLFQREPVDIVLMDLQMPEMDGIEATRAIRRMEAGSHTPIVALTAHAMSTDRERCISAGMDDYLSKPISPDRLIATVEQHATTHVEP